MKNLNIDFGDRVAENESQELAAYFIKTENWNDIINGKADIAFGSKGAEKSALYTLLLGQANQLMNKGITLISAEKAKGQSVFSDIKDAPPTTEEEFIVLWKIYLCQLIVKELISTEKCIEEAKYVKDKLVEAGLIEEENPLKRLINSAKSYAYRMLNPASIEGGVGLDSMVSGKISFRDPTIEKRKLGFVSIDELLEKLNVFLKKKELRFWVLFDRLDVAFDQDTNLEENALRNCVVIVKRCAKVPGCIQVT